MSNELTTLSTLVIKGNAINEQMLFHGGQYVIHAAQLGVILDEIKTKENIKTNADFSEFLSREMPKVDRSKANRYIQISKQFPDLLESSGATSRLGYSQVVELLSAPEELKNETIERIEAGEDVTIKEIQRLKKESAEAKEMLESANKNAMQLALKIDAKQGEIAELKGQNWKLENQQQQIIDAKVNEEKAKLILENQQAIAESKRLAENAKAELERLKREQEKAIKDGVQREIKNLDDELARKQYQIEIHSRDIEKLREVEKNLNREVGLHSIQKKAIEKIKDNLSFLKSSFNDAFDTNVIIHELDSEWDAIYYAISSIKKDMAQWRDKCAPIESEALIGELVDE